MAGVDLVGGGVEWAADVGLRYATLGIAILLKQPVQSLHDIVVDQIVQINKALAKSPYCSAALQPQHKLIKEELVKARGLLADGDRLVSLQDDESKQYRRTAYLDAYKISHGAGERLASASGEDWFLVSAAGKVVDSAKSAGKAALDSSEKVVTKVSDTYAAAGKEIPKAGGAVAEKAGDQVAKVGGTLKTVLYIAGGGVAVSAIGYAVVRARQSAPTRGR
jgi:hypothetical protein